MCPWRDENEVGANLKASNQIFCRPFPRKSRYSTSMIDYSIRRAEECRPVIVPTSHATLGKYQPLRSSVILSNYCKYAVKCTPMPEGHTSSISSCTSYIHLTQNFIMVGFGPGSELCIACLREFTVNGIAETLDPQNTNTT